MKREALDCALLREVAAYLDGAGKRVARDYNVIRINELTLKVCSGAMSK